MQAIRILLDNEQYCRKGNHIVDKSEFYEKNKSQCKECIRNINKENYQKKKQNEQIELEKCDYLAQELSLHYVTTNDVEQDRYKYEVDLENSDILFVEDNDFGVNLMKYQTIPYNKHEFKKHLINTFELDPVVYNFMSFDDLLNEMADHGIVIYRLE